MYRNLPFLCMTMELLMSPITSLEKLDVARFESPAILKKLAISSRRLAELKGKRNRRVDPESRHPDQYLELAGGEGQLRD